MIKYLKTENASITIEYSKKILFKFLHNSIIFIDNCGLQRLFIECNANELKNVYNELNLYTFQNTTVFIKVKNYNEKYIEDLNKVNEKFYTIICCNIEEFNNIKFDKGYYYELNFKYEEADEIIKIINNYDNILLKIDYDLSEIKNVNNALDRIVRNNKGNDLNFSNLFISKNLIYSCPYNIYLNNENSNRSYGNNIPRNIFIDHIGNVYCLSVKSKNIIIGNINKKSIETIISNCKHETGYKNFVKYNEKLFIDYLNQCPFLMIDYNAFLTEVILWTKQI